MTGENITLPRIVIDAPDVPWLADAAITSWSVERELVGSALPGQIRFRSGLSVGDAKVSVVRPGVHPTPWAAAESARVVAGGAARLYADLPDGERDLGSWVVAPTSGSLLSPEIPVDLAEAQFAARGREHLLPPGGFYTAPIPTMGHPKGNPAPEAAWIVDRMAAQAGYFHVPPLAPSGLLSIPLTGSFHSDQADLKVLGQDITWGTPTGPLGPDGEVGFLATFYYRTADPVFEALYTQDPVYLALNATGVVRLYDLFSRLDIIIDTDNETVSVRNDYLTGSLETGSYVAGESDVWPNRVQLEIQRTHNGTQWTSITVRARSGPDAAWSSPIVSSTGTPVVDTRRLNSLHFLAGYEYGPHTAPPPGALSGIQFSAAADPELWAPPTALLKPLGGTVPCPYLPPEMDPWTAIQEVAGAWMGAAYVDRDGRLVLLDRDDLAGAGTPGVEVNIGREWTDLPWTLDPDDAADRLEVTFNPPSITDAPTAIDPDYGTRPPEVWRSDDAVAIGPGETVVVKAAVDRYYSGLFADFYGAWITPDPAVESGGFYFSDTDYLSSGSTYSAFDTARAVGSHSPDGALGRSTRAISTARIETTWTNASGSTQYLVDANAEPCLILRARRTGTFETQQVIERGASKDDALNAVTVDLGYYVQTQEAAEAIADFLWARISSGALWRASSVRCRLDWDHEIGRVLRLKHSRTGLEVKALTTKVAYDGSPGEIAQTLDLVLLPWTWGDFDDTWDGQEWDDFDAAWSARTWDDFDLDPLDLAGA